MITLREAYQNSKETLSRVYDQSEASAVLKLVFEYQFSKTSKDVLIKGDEHFEQLEELQAILNRLTQHEPIQHILGYEFFSGLKIAVSSDVLIPRPETEELLNWVVEEENDSISVIADFCTGSGCLALALRKYFPNSKVIATDISEKALELAKKSELVNFNSTSIEWALHDLLKQDYILEYPDVIVCNPPYIKIEEKDIMHANVLDFEPHLALFVYDSDALLFYKIVIELFLEKDMPNIYFELNPLTAEELGSWCLDKGLNCQFRVDLSGKKRFARISK
jgi:release factor glutamine methyltransferase